MFRLRNEAIGRPCQFSIEGICNGNPATSQWVHSDSQIDGKGMGIKARDEEGAIGCSACHAWIHSSGPTREEKRQAFEAARDRTRSLLRNLKYIDRGINVSPLTR